MSFSKHIETYISWDNINEWEHWQFKVITVEPIPNPIDVNGDSEFYRALGAVFDYHNKRRKIV